MVPNNVSGIDGSYDSCCQLMGKIYGSLFIPTLMKLLKDRKVFRPGFS